MSSFSITFFSLFDIPFWSVSLVTFLSFFLYYLFHSIYNSQKCLNYFKVPNYKETIQKIHLKPTARLGGLVIYLGLLLFAQLNSDSIPGLTYLRQILFSCIPLIIFTLPEDIYFNVRPIFRFFGIILSSLVFLALNADPFPVIDIPWISSFLNNHVIATIFYLIGISAISNGTNIIDGSNGLAATTVFFSLIALFFASYYAQDIVLMSAILPILWFLFIFILVNYPNGYIFLGDLGAYFLGFIISIFCILFYGRHPNFPSWGALAILGYPMFEVFLSFIRKPLMKASPFRPDRYHLHLLLFDYLKRKNDLKRANWKVMLFLLPLLSLPLAVPIYLSNLSALLILLGVSVLTYFIMYFFYLFMSFNPRIK